MLIQLADCRVKLPTLVALQVLFLFFFCVITHVPSHFAVCNKSLPAKLTFERSVSSVNAHMVSKPGPISEQLPALVAREVALSSVQVLVTFQDEARVK